jgi:membrane-bound lytic murein transglycosylase F
MTKKVFFLIMLFAVMSGGKVEGRVTGDDASSQDSNTFTGSFLMWPLPQQIISEYDPIIRHVADSRGYDWRFISAIAYAESNFKPNAVSRMGAQGLMQVMPAVAKDLGVARDKMRDPLTNVTMGVDVLDRISGTLRFPGSISERDRLSITLAAYNSGVGHVLDARRLALKYGENYNSWRVVSKYLVLKSLPEFYEDEVVHSGAFRGSNETLGYVTKVLRYYDKYRELTDM